MSTTTETMLPLTAEELADTPRARATRVSYNWSHFGRYTVWIAEVPFFGWSVVTDYGKPGVESVVTSPRTRENCIAALADYVRNYGDPRWGHNLAVEEWETVSVKLHAWITHTQALGLTWAPLPE